MYICMYVRRYVNTKSAFASFSFFWAKVILSRLPRICLLTKPTPIGLVFNFLGQQSVSSCVFCDNILFSYEYFFPIQS